jgi:hypothetical protein
MKAEEVACAHARIEFLESARPLADGLNAVMDLAAMPGGDER